MSAVILVIEKAYNMIWTRGLLIKMQNIGIGGKMLCWVKSFLSEIVIPVRIGKTYSNPMNIENGAPQGSIISPTRFNIAIIKLPSVLHPVISVYSFCR